VGMLNDCLFVCLICGFFLMIGIDMIVSMSDVFV